MDIYLQVLRGRTMYIVRLRHIGKMRVKTGAGVTGIEPTRGLERAE
jgi:hypothetical protein